MALIDVDDLPAGSAEVLRRRASVAGLPVAEYVRGELVARARTRVPDDALVEFALAQGRDLGSPWDDDAMLLEETYRLPVEVVDRLAHRARAVGQPLGEYVHAQLVRLARRSTMDDVMDEFREAQRRDPSLRLDMDAIESSLRHVRGE